VIHTGNHVGCERRVYVTPGITSYFRAYSFYLSCWTTTIQRLNNTTKRLHFKTLPADLHCLQNHNVCRSTLLSRARSRIYTLRRPWAIELISCPAQNHLKSASDLIYTKSFLLKLTMSMPANTACPCGGTIYHKADVFGKTIIETSCTLHRFWDIHLLSFFL